MLSRALSLATVTLLIGFCAAERVQAQENLEAGKSPSQIFADTCTACHKGSRGLLKTVAPGSLPSFLRQHYTTSPAMAGVLASYLISNGATDTRISAGQPKGAKEARQEGRPDQKPAEQLDRFGRRLRPATASQETRPEADPRQEPKQAARPENEGPQGHKRLARPPEPPEGARPDVDGQVPAQAQVAGERGPDGRKLSAKQRLSKRGKPSIEEPPKVEEPLINEPPKSEAATKEEGKPEEAKPVGETPSQSAKVEPARESGGETSTLRSDPVPPVTPAPPATTPPAESAVSVSGGSEPPAAPAVSSPPVAVTAASAPPLPAMVPAGPPAPPISQ
jgi:hypothetical protein